MSDKEYKNCRITNPHEIFLEAVKFLPKGQLAIVDIGAGYLNETRYLLQKGYAVTAIDKNPLPEELKDLVTPNLLYTQCDFNTYNFEPSSIDFLIALHSLFFVDPKNFDSFFIKLLESLKPNGVIVGDILGLHDSWLTAAKRPMTFITQDKIIELIKMTTVSYDIISLQDKEWNGAQYDGTLKHWHTIEFIIKRK